MPSGLVVVGEQGPGGRLAGVVVVPDDGGQGEDALQPTVPPPLSQGAGGRATCGCTQRPVSCCPLLSRLSGRLRTQHGPIPLTDSSSRGRVSLTCGWGLLALGWAPRGRPPSPWLGRRPRRTPGGEGAHLLVGRHGQGRGGQTLGRATVMIVAHHLAPPGRRSQGEGGRSP
jgi:hypothetical protein